MNRRSCSRIWWTRCTADSSRLLQKAAKDPEVAAVIVMINSPGGGITATDLMHKATIDFKKKTRKPVVACLTDIAASGGYYLAAAADKIIAHETTLTGSIGVIIPLYDFTDLMSKLGVKQNFVTSGSLKSMGSPFTKLSDEQKKLFQDMVLRVIQFKEEEFIMLDL